MPEVLELNTYIISRPQRFEFFEPYIGEDKDGKKLFDVKKTFIEDTYTLTVASSEVPMGYLTGKAVSIRQSYELHDDGKSLIGRVLKEQDNGLEKTFVLQDDKGNKMALVKISSPQDKAKDATAGSKGSLSMPDISTKITNMDGTAVIANLSFLHDSNEASHGNPISQIIKVPNTKLVLEILDKNMPHIILLEFAIAIDHLLNPSSGHDFRIK